MKKITYTEFSNLLHSPILKTQQEVEMLSRDLVPEEYVDNNDELVQRHVWLETGVIRMRHRLGWSDIVITYTEGYSLVENRPDSLSCGCEGIDEPWQIEGAEVMMPEGTPADMALLAEAMEAALPRPDYTTLRQKEVLVLSSGKDKDTDERFVIEADDQPSLAFSGKKLGMVSSWRPDCSGNWTELALYQTRGGKYVAVTMGKTQWAGQRDRCSAAVCETINDVKAYFQYGWLAKELYTELNIDYTTAVA